MVNAGPSTRDLVSNALKELNNRKGVSLQAIKKWVGDNHKKEVKAVYIRKALKSGLATGWFETHHQRKGSYKLGAASKKKAAPKKKKVVKKKAPKKKKAATKKKTTKKKSATKKKKTTKKKTTKKKTTKKSKK